MVKVTPDVIVQVSPKSILPPAIVASVVNVIDAASAS